MSKVKHPTYQSWRSRCGDTRHTESRNSSYLIRPDTSENCPLLSKRQKCPWSGRYVPRCPTRNIRLFFPGANYLVVLLLLIVRLGLSASLDGRPEWIPLLPEGEATVARLFESGEVLQMYHLQATARLYEQGGLNHDLSFILTAVAFSSLERPDTQVSMAYHPTNMTISLLPTISEDGRELRWEHQVASASYTNNLDQNYWTGTSYMGETTGAFFSYAVEFSLDYHRENPRYQPFSVYDDYPGHEFLVASSCDEFVWALFAKAQELGVRLIPSLMPKKHKIIIYSQTEPELIILDGGDGGGGRRDDSLAADDDGDNIVGDYSAGSRTPSSWRSSSSVSNGDGDGGGDRHLRSGVEQPSRRSLTTTASEATVPLALEEGDEGFEVTPVPAVATMMPAYPVGVSDGSSAENMSTQAMVEAINSTWEGGSDGEGLPAAAADGEGDLETPEPTVSPVTSDKASEEDDDWQQVVTYYQSLQLCLQERQFSFVQSLEDFAESFDCLDDVAFISIGPREYYKVNLTSSKVDHVSLAEDLPEVQRTRNGFALVDCLLVIWIVLILACGVHGMLWQGGVMQHWLKTSGYAQADSTDLEDVLSDRQPSLTRKISSMYLRFSKRFLSKSEGEAHGGVPDDVGVASVGEGVEVTAAVTTVAESEVTGSPVGGGSSPTRTDSEFTIVNGTDGAGSEGPKRGGFRANGRRGERAGNWGRDKFDQDSLDVEVGSEDVDSGWSGRSWGRQRRSVRHHRGAVGDKTADTANAEGVGGSVMFGADSEGVEMGSAASWRRPHGRGVDDGVDVLEGSGNGVNATGLHGRRHLYSSPSREWSNAAVAWGTNYNDGGRDLWIRFPDSPSQPQSKPVEGVRVLQEDGADGGERFPQEEKQEEGHRDRSSRTGSVSSLTAKDYPQSGAVDVRGVSPRSEGPIGNSCRENGIGGAAVVAEEEKLD